MTLFKSLLFLHGYIADPQLASELARRPQASTIPQLPYDLWGNPNDTGFALSHYTLFNGVNITTTQTSVPEGGVGVGLLGLLLAGMGWARKRLAA